LLCLSPSLSLNRCIDTMHRRRITAGSRTHDRIVQCSKVHSNMYMNCPTNF
jgi:hypothetical protein